jgi:methyltransferase (TIGR00027 family)
MKAINTAMGVAWTRATGNLYPKKTRLFDDPYSERLLSPVYRFFTFFQHSPRINDAMARMKYMGWFFCRFRYIDDVLKDCLAEKDLESVVNIGSGYDCRAYYIPGVEKVRYFEVDYPSIIEDKKARMKKILGKLPANVVYVPIDFESQSLGAGLKKAGYDLGSKTLFIWEGVTQYLSKEANVRTLEYIAKAAKGSKIVFSYVLNDFIEGRNLKGPAEKSMYKWLVKRFGLFKSGFEQKMMKKYLSGHNLSLMEDIGAEEMRERYLIKSKLDFYLLDIERIALARVR